MYSSFTEESENMNKTNEQSPESFYITYYPSGVYTEIRGKPSKNKLKQIITSNYNVKGISGKNKPELVLLFQKLYKDSLISKIEPTTSEKQPIIDTNKFILGQRVKYKGEYLCHINDIHNDGDEIYYTIIFYTDYQIQTIEKHLDYL